MPCPKYYSIPDLFFSEYAVWFLKNKIKNLLTLVVNQISFELTLVATVKSSTK